MTENGRRVGDLVEMPETTWTLQFTPDLIGRIGIVTAERQNAIEVKIIGDVWHDPDIHWPHYAWKKLQ